MLTEALLYCVGGSLQPVSRLIAGGCYQTCDRSSRLGNALALGGRKQLYTGPVDFLFDCALGFDLPIMGEFVRFGQHKMEGQPKLGAPIQ